MNKIVLDKEDVIVVEDDLDIFVDAKKEKEIYLCSNNCDACIHYHIGQNSHLTVYHYSIDSSLDISMHLMEENASISYSYYTINEDDHTFHCSIFHEASKTESHVTSHGVNIRDKSLLFDIDPHVLKDAKLCICNQENRIINLGCGSSTIRPNLFIDHYNVVSNHSAYIGSFSEEALFYLMSRGLSREDSYQLLLQSFLMNDFDRIREVFPQFLEKLKEL